ncbi:MAG: ORF6N domain-containing protein [Candidatus Marinimicrobia bacterium]|nr:ORF6N domain-containing protein [Candidatus Neomarinimicrobiota bacterium]
MNKERIQIITIGQDQIQNLIINIRGEQMMIDRDLANLYGVETKVLNQAVKRNKDRFPDTFRIQLSDVEKTELVTNCDRFEKLKHASTNPYAFTEQGVAMLSAVLRSDTAIKVSVQIINAFVTMRKFIGSNAKLFQRVDRLELKQLEHDQKFDKIFDAIEQKEITPKQGIIYDGQIFDAHMFISKIIRSAKKSIIILDNYVDDSVLTLLIDREKGVAAKIYTQSISKRLALDVKKFNEQYEPVKVKELKNNHDRFIIIDEKEIYHSGASLKDLGKKISAFTKFDKDGLELLEKLK